MDSQSDLCPLPLTSPIFDYGVPTISRLLKIIGPFCRISSLLKDSFAKETYNFKEPTNRSHPIVMSDLCPLILTMTSLVLLYALRPGLCL